MNWPAILTVWLVARLWTNFCYYTAPTIPALFFLVIGGSLVLTHEVLYYVGRDEE